MKEKKCKRCNEVKASTEFTEIKLKSGKPSLHANCKECRRKEYKKTKRVVCKCCNKLKTKKFLDKKGICSVCRRSSRLKQQKDKSNENKLESIFEEAHRLKGKAKLSLNELKKVEQDKLKNGYKWVWEEVRTSKSTSTKQRVLRRVN